MNNISKFSHFDCLNCKLAKQPSLSFSNSASLCDTSFGLIHSNIWSRAINKLGFTFLNIVLPYIKSMLILQIWSTHNSLAQLKSFVLIMRWNTRTRLLSFLAHQGTLIQRSCPHTSQQNGRAERKHCHVLDSSRAQLLSDIVFAVHIVSQFMAPPCTIHFTVVFHILRYIKDTLGHGLQFSSQSSLDSLMLIGQVIPLIAKVHHWLLLLFR